MRDDDNGRQFLVIYVKGVKRMLLSTLIDYVNGSEKIDSINQNCKNHLLGDFCPTKSIGSSGEIEISSPDVCYFCNFNHVQ